MKMMRSVVLSLIAALLAAPLLHGQDLSKYRDFSLGMSLADVSKRAGIVPADAKVISQQPALLQEFTWFPSQPFESPLPAEPVQKVLFSFYNGELYRMLVTYESSAVEGLTDKDMIQVLSTKYGTATTPAADINFPTIEAFSATERVIARWEDSLYSCNLFQPSLSDTFAVVMFTKRLDAQAAAAIAESVRLEQQEAPQKEAARVKKAGEDLEAQRQKNIKALRP